MKYLQDYIGAEQTRVLDKYNAFFAFSKKQFDEHKKEGEKYISLDGGLIAVKATVEELIEELTLVHENGIKQDLKENGKYSIIQRELGNHEAQITMSIEDTKDALEGYGINEDEIKAEYKIYMKACIDQNLF